MKQNEPKTAVKGAKKLQQIIREKEKIFRPGHIVKTTRNI